MAKKHGGKKWRPVQQQRAIMASLRERGKLKKPQKQETFIPAHHTEAQLSTVLNWFKSAKTTDTEAEKAQRVGKWIGIQKIVSKKKGRGQYGSAKPIKTVLEAHKTKRLTDTGKIVERPYEYYETGGIEKGTHIDVSDLKKKLGKLGLKYKWWRSPEANVQMLLQERMAIQAQKVKQKYGMTPEQLAGRKFERLEQASYTTPIILKRQNKDIQEILRSIRQKKKKDPWEQAYRKSEKLPSWWRGEFLTPEEQKLREVAIEKGLPIPPGWILRSELEAERKLKKDILKQKLATRDVGKQLMFGGYPMETQKQIIRDIAKYRGLPPTQTEEREKEEGWFVLPPSARTVDYAQVVSRDPYVTQRKIYGPERIAISDARSIPAYEKRIMKIGMGEVELRGSLQRHKARPQPFAYFKREPKTPLHLPDPNLKEVPIRNVLIKDAMQAVQVGKTPIEWNLKFDKKGRYISGKYVAGGEPIYEKKEHKDVILKSGGLHAGKTIKMKEREVGFGKKTSLLEPPAKEDPFYRQELERYYNAGGQHPVLSEAQQAFIGGSARREIDAINTMLRYKYKTQGRLAKFEEKPWEETASPTPGFEIPMKYENITLRSGEVIGRMVPMETDPTRLRERTVRILPAHVLADDKEARLKKEQELYEAGLIDTKPGQHPHDVLRERATERSRKEAQKATTEELKDLDLMRFHYGRSYNTLVEDMKRKAIQNVPEIKYLRKNLTFLKKQQKQAEREKLAYEKSQSKYLTNIRKRQYEEYKKRKEQPLWSRFIAKIKAS